MHILFRVCTLATGELLSKIFSQQPTKILKEDRVNAPSYTLRPYMYIYFCTHNMK